MSLREGERVEVTISDDQVLLGLALARRTLEKMFAGKSAEAWRAEYAGAYDWGTDVGREIVPE